MEIRFNLSNEDYEKLKKDAEKRGITLQDLIRQYFTRGLWLDQVISDPKKKIIIQGEDGSNSNVSSSSS
jgi:hypothetical protein